jgi:hypothetical protein
MAKNYVDNLSEEVKKGLLEKAEQGHAHAGTYYRCTSFHGRCGNAYIREERLAHLLGVVVDRIQLPERVARAITRRLHISQAELEQVRGRSSARLLDRQRALQAKIDHDLIVRGNETGECGGPNAQTVRVGVQVAEREGFEPSVGFPLHTLSKRAPSASRSSLRFRINDLQAVLGARTPNCDRPLNPSRSLTGTDPPAEVPRTSVRPV